LIKSSIVVIQWAVCSDWLMFSCGVSVCCCWCHTFTDRHKHRCWTCSVKLWNSPKHQWWRRRHSTAFAVWTADHCWRHADCWWRHANRWWRHADGWRHSRWTRNCLNCIVMS